MRRITNEEAIEVLEDMKVKVEIPKAAVTQYKRNVALDMAIKSLELFGNSEQLPSSQPDTIPLDWIQRYADDWEDMNYAYDNPILGMLEDWREERE